MKKTIYVFLSLFSFGFIANAQDNSVELRTGGGTLVSSHTSLQTAYNAVPNPLDQSYVIEITSIYTGAAETFPITLSLRDSASNSRTVTIRPKAGVTSVTVGGTAAGQPIILFSNADYIILDGSAGGIGNSMNLTIQNLATTSSSFTLRFLDGATYNTVKWCKIINSTQATAGPRAIEIGTSVSNPSGNSFNYITFNEIGGGRSGIGLAGTAANPNLSNYIYFNKIYDWAYAAVWVLSSSNNTVIEKNEMWQTAGYSTTPTGVIFGAVINLDIISNKMYDLQGTSTTVRGISGSMGVGSVLNIVNNFISLMLDNGTKTSIYAIQVTGANEYTTNIHNNTIRLGGNHTGGTAGVVISAGIVKGSTSATGTFNMKNNLVLNTRSGGTTGTFHTGFFAGTTNLVGNLDIDYNVYYTNNGVDSFHSAWNGVLYNSLAQYKDSAAPHEQHTIFKATNFVSGTDLHLAGSSVGDVDLVGMPIVGITHDIDGDVRSATHPYRGADEAATPIPVELSLFTAGVDGNSVMLSWRTATELNTHSFIVERKSSDDNWLTIGSVQAAGASTEIRNYSFVDNSVTEGKYSYRLRMNDLDGSYSYSSIIEIEIGSPMEFSLEQNYPNPFNPSTTINFSTAHTAIVKLVLFNQIGEEVKTLINQEMNAGKYSLNFDASNLPSGVYFYKLTAGTFTSTKKFILMK